MGISIDALRAAVFGSPPASTERVLELTREQHWCVPDARALAGRALSAGALLKRLEAEAVEVSPGGTRHMIATAAQKCDAARRVRFGGVSCGVAASAHVSCGVAASAHVAILLLVYRRRLYALF